MLSERIQIEKVTYYTNSSYKMFRMGKSKETESINKSVDARVQRQEEMKSDKTQVSFWVMKMFWNQW